MNLFTIATSDIAGADFDTLDSADQETVAQAIADSINQAAVQIDRFPEGVSVLLALGSLNVTLNSFIHHLPTVIVELVASL